MKILNLNSIGRMVWQPCWRRRGRPKRRFMDVVMADMRVVGVTIEDVEDRAKWIRMIRSGDP